MSDRATWLTRRRSCLGSSEAWQLFIPWLSRRGVVEVDLGAGVAQVAMPLKDSGPHKVWLAKQSGELEDEPTDPDDPRNRGHFYEDAVACIAAAKLGLPLDRLTWTRHPEHPWMGATGDRLLGQDQGLECKYVTYSHNRQIWYEDAAPLFVQLQALWCAAVYGLEVWHIAAEVPGRGHVLYPPVRLSVAGAWLERMVQVCGRWWVRHVEGGVAPEPDGTASCWESLKRTYAHHGNEIRKATPDEEAALDAWQQAESRLRAAQLERDAARHRVCALIGDDLGVRAGGLGTATWKADVNGHRRLNWSAWRGM